jgi:hypothetical protein
MRRAENPRASAQLPNSSPEQTQGRPSQEGGRVAMRQTKLGDPFRGDCSKKESGGRHAALAKETQLAVKPGPIAVSNVREGKPA